MKTRILYILIVLVSVQVYGQRKYAASRYFEEYAYTKSAELYTKIYQKGDDSQEVLERLGDSYYFNNNTKAAEQWYAELVEKYEQSTSPEYLYRYAQVLKSNEQYTKANALIKKFNLVAQGDSRGDELSENFNYFVDYSKNEDITVHFNNLSVNTPYSDFGGYSLGKEYYFSSTRPSVKRDNKIYKWNEQPFLNLYKATQTEVSSNLELQDVSFLAINSPYHDASPVFTKDGKTMYYTRDNYDGKRRGRDNKRETHLKLYKASLVDGKWSDITELPFNDDAYSIGHPALSIDENTLYFVSDMPGGLGYTDIYKVSINKDGSYGNPENLGKEINTEGREMFPFVSQDNKLYFSSDGHLGLGGLDIFESEIKGSSFGKVQNIKAPFNSPADDFGFSLNIDNQTHGFLSSNREGGEGDDDIYSFIINAKVPCSQSIAGELRDSKTNDLLADATVKLLDSQGKVIQTKSTNASGAYSFGVVPCDSKYVVVGEKTNYTSANTDVLLDAERDKKNYANLSLTPLIKTEQGVSQIVINPIYFDFDKWNIRADAEYELEKIVTVMQNDASIVIKIESHTDSRGTKSYNRQLSDRRAKSTRDYLYARGISRDRVESAIGFGEDQLLNRCDDANQKNCSKEEHQQNRRSYFYIVRGGENVSVQGQ